MVAIQRPLRKQPATKRVQMFVDKIIEKQWMSACGKKVYSTKYVARGISNVTSVRTFTHPHLELQGVFSTPLSGVNVQMRDTRTNQTFWFIVSPE